MFWNAEEHFEIRIVTPELTGHFLDEEKAANFVQSCITKSCNVLMFQTASDALTSFCSMCKITYKDNKALKLHLVKAKCSLREKSPKKDQEQYGCHRCEEVFSERPALLRHLLFQCSRRHELECSRCQNIFATDEDLSQHVEACVVRNARFPPVLSSGRKSVGFHCEQCGRHFASKNGLRQHALSCREEPGTVSTDKSISAREKGLSERVPSVLGRRRPTGRIRRTPKKFADESFEKGWADTRDSKPECVLKTTPAASTKPAMQLIRLSSGKVMQVIGRVKNPKGSDSDTMTGYVLKDFTGTGKVTEVKAYPVPSMDQTDNNVASPSKDEQSTISTSDCPDTNEVSQEDEGPIGKRSHGKETQSSEGELNDDQEVLSGDSGQNVITVSIDENELISLPD